MIFIVAGHSVLHGGVEMPLTVNGIFAFVMTQGSRIGVNIFCFTVRIFFCYEGNLYR